MSNECSDRDVLPPSRPIFSDTNCEMLVVMSNDSSTGVSNALL